MRKVSVGFLAALISGAAFSQSTSSKPAFEKADIHPAITTGGIGGGRGGFPYSAKGRYEIRNATLLNLITSAYGVDPEKVVGGPTWLEWNRFDIVAAMPSDTPPETQKVMLQTLLADRFRLVIHNDTKNLTGYVLTNDRLQHTGMSVGNLLSLNFYPCDQGQITCNNNNCNIWRQTINVNNGAAQAAQEYRYDALNRLTMAEEKTATWTTGPACPDATGVWTQQNTFDPAGNRTAGCRGGLSTMNGEVATFNATNMAR
jgi:hypothetical protein